MRFILFLLLLIPIAGQAHAFGGDNCPIFLKAYLLPDAPDSAADGSGDPSGPVSFRNVLFALTVVPPSGEYLYGAESKEGLPTDVVDYFAPREGFPMSSLGQAQIDELLE